MFVLIGVQFFYPRIYTLIYTCILHTVILYQLFLFRANNLQTIVWFQVFLSNTNNYIVSSNFFYLGRTAKIGTLIKYQF